MVQYEKAETVKLNILLDYGKALNDKLVVNNLEEIFKKYDKEIDKNSKGIKSS